MRRAKKISIVVAILAAGTAVAVCFRKPEATTAQNGVSPINEVDVSDRATPETPPKVGSATRGSAYRSTDTMGAEAKLAGRIEPVATPIVPIGPGGERQNGPGMRTLAGTSLPSVQRPVEMTAAPNVREEAAAAQESRKPEQKPLGWREPNRPFERSWGSQSQSGEHGDSSFANVPAGRHKIVDGDTLAALAARYLGSSAKAADIYDFNRDVLTSIELLPIGKELRIPPHEYRRPTVESDVQRINMVDRRSNFDLVPILAADTPSQSPTQKSIQSPTASTLPKPIMPPSTASTYVVQPYDTLALISRRVYGDLAHQQAIIAANTQQLRTPKDLRPGMTLVIPRRSK